MRLVIAGTSGYIGSAFVNECRARGHIAVHLYRPEYENASRLAKTLKEIDPLLVVNCAAYIPPESVSQCDQNMAETIRANLMLPHMLAMVCQRAGVPFAQISTGCLWDDGKEHVESDPPQRAFNGHCGNYIGVKALAEEAVRNNCDKHYIWRVRLPFDEFDHPRNYLSKLSKFEEVWLHRNTICHRGDFVKACLDLWQADAAWGVYNCCNPGTVSAWDIAEKLVESGIRNTLPKMGAGPSCGSLLSVKKLLDAGVKIRPIHEALEHSIKNWRKA